MLKDIIKTLKVNHYVKNIIVFIPLIFSLKITELVSCLNAVLIFIAFCLISSAVYVLNDLVDIEKDRQHPVKCKRAIASGRISKPCAITLMLVVMTIALSISLFLNKTCLLIVGCYFILNVFYSFFLKNIALIDVTCIAIGFILRVLAGCFAISVLPSALVILLTFFLSNFFTFAKRSLELRLVSENSATRKSLKELDVDSVNKFVLMSAVLSVAFYVTYMLDITTIEKVGSQYIYITTIPFALIIYRLFLLINSKNIADDPIIYIEQDKVLKSLFVFYLIVLAVVLTVLK